MSYLLKEIEHYSRDAASVLKRADLHTDSDICSLTREELHELFPGPEKLKLRRVIFEKVQKVQKRTQKPAQVLRELKNFIPDECLRAALTSNGVLADYLSILKDMKTQMNNIQSFLDDHIELLQDAMPCHTGGQMRHNTSPPDGSAQGETSKGTSSGEMMPYAGSTHQHKLQSSPKKKVLLQVKYVKVVTGKTFRADDQLMDKVMANTQDRLQFIESKEDAHTIIVFCPVISRIGSDINAAMSNNRDDKPVILVLMHHTHEVRCTASLRTLGKASYPQVVLYVSVFYHETTGLLQCKENDSAAFDIQRVLVENSCKHAGENAPDAVSFLKGGTPDGNNRDSDSSGGYFSMPKFGGLFRR